MGVLEGKTALVTGAASGSGRSTAEAFAKEGISHVALIDVDYEKLISTSKILERMKVDFSVYCADVTKEEEVESALSEIISSIGRLDIAFNNAGINHPSS